MSRDLPVGQHLLRSADASGQSGLVMDARNAAAFAFVHASVTNGSALLAVQAAPDATAWNTALQVTAIAAGVTAQVSAFYPFVRAHVVQRWGNATAHLHYTPGVT